MYTNRILFCTGPDVNFDFFYFPPPPLGYLRWWRHRYLPGIPWKIPHFNGQKFGINKKRVIGLPENTEKPAK